MMLTNINIKADMPVKEKLIEIVDLQVLTNDSTQIGDTIQVAATFRSQVSGNVIFGLALYGNVSLVSDTTRNTIHRDSMAVQADSLNTMIFYVKPTAAVMSKVGFGVSVTSDNPYVLDPFTNPTDVKAIDFGNRSWVDGLPFECTEIVNQDLNCKTYVYTHLTPWVYKLDRTTVNFSGKVLYTDWWTPRGEVYPVVKGALNTVWLFWKDLTDNTKLFHPVPYQGKPIEGVHYARCDADGNFTFNFSFLDDSLYRPQANFQRVLFIGKENEALSLISQNNHAEISGMKNPDIDGTNIRVYRKEFPVNCNFCELEPISFEQFTLGEEGGVFRHITLTRKFLIDRLQLNPVNYATELPPRVEVEIRFKEGPCYYFNGRIFMVHHTPLERSAPTPILMSHEYGHHYHTNISGYAWGIDEIKEGWATFMSMAFTSWEFNKYGDEKDFAEDTEMGPFTSLYNINPSNNSVIQDFPRFGNISKVSYTQSGSPAIGFDMCRFACYLWNVYDSHTDGDFMSPRYEGYNNDDVNGKGKAVFDFFVNYNRNFLTLTNGFLDPYSLETFNSILKLNLAPGNTELQASIQRICDFMEFNKLTLPLVTSTRMRSPQIALSTQPNGNYKRLNFQSKAYSESIGVGQVNDYVANVKDATWTFSFCNRETGVKIYQSSNQNGPFTPLTFIPYTSSGYYYDLALSPRTYNHVTATNTGGGDSYYFREVISNAKISIPDESESEFLSNIYPNPAAFSVSIESPEFLNKNIIYEIYDLSANLVHSDHTKAVSNKIFISIPSFLNSGTYFIKAKESDTETTLLSQTFLIQR